MKTILGVVRASTVRQEVESQKEELKQYIISNGYNEEEIEWIETAGASARKANKEYLDMLESIKTKILESGTIKACAFWHLNRLGRIEKYIVLMKEWFITNKIQVYVKTPNLTLLREDGTLDSGANIAWGVFASIVSYETMEMFDKMLRGKNRNKREGVYNGGTVLIGTMVDPITKKIIPNYEEISLLITIFEEYATRNYSTYGLEKELDERGITQRGKKITAQWLQRILTTDALRPLVGEVLYDKVQSIVRERNPKRKSKHIHIAGGLVTCPICGGRMFAETKGYKCYNHFSQFKREGRVECTNSTKINIDVIDNLALWFAYYDYEDFILQFNEDNVEELEKRAQVIGMKIEEVAHKADKLKVKLNNIKDMRAEGELTKEEYYKKKEIYYNELLTLQESNNALRHLGEKLAFEIKTIRSSSNIDKAVKAHQGLETCTAEEAYDIVHKFVKNITYTKESNREFTIYITMINGKEWTLKYYPFAKNDKVLRTIKVEDGTTGRFMLRKYFSNGERITDEIFISLL